jgi:hypothetical protein
VNFANYAYVIGEWAGLIADGWQTFFAAVLTLRFEFGFVAESLLVEVVGIHFGICSLDGCEYVAMRIEIVMHFAGNGGPYYFDIPSLYHIHFDSVVGFGGEFHIRPKWMNDYFVEVSHANDCLAIGPNGVVMTNDVSVDDGQFVRFVRN